MTQRIIFRAEGDQVGQRLDAALARLAPEQSRQSWSDLIRNGSVIVNASPVKSSHMLKDGDEVFMLATESKAKASTEPDLLQQDIPVLYKDEEVIVINKPAGVVVHAAGESDTEPSVASHFADQIEQDGTVRSGIVHRLDKDTSGVMVLARTLEAADYLRAQFKARKVQKSYIALVWGRPKDKQARIELPLARNRTSPTKMSVTPDGKTAITEYKIAHEYRDFSLLDVHILTGRMHQIRVHLAYLGHPVVGDAVYGGARPLPAGKVLRRQFLHASELGLMLPNGERASFSAPLPADLKEFLESSEA